MAQFYTLEEAARVLGMNAEELKSKAQSREVRASSLTVVRGDSVSLTSMSSRDGVDWEATPSFGCPILRCPPPRLAPATFRTWTSLNSTSG